jgi:hypothetical protein
LTTYRFDVPIEVQFYDSSPRPRVVIRTDRAEALGLLKQTLLRLAQETSPASVSMRDLPEIDLLDLEELTLERVRSSDRVAPTIRALRRKGKVAVQWWGDHEDWMTRALLIDGLLASPVGGHQFLTGYESLDPVEVEISFRESDRIGQRPAPNH